ncbi:MAG: hypothetical protein QM705_12900 [Ancrocorticia sp.]
MNSAIPNDVHESNKTRIVFRGHPENTASVQPLTPRNNLLGSLAERTMMQSRQLPVVDRRRDFELDRHR